MLTYIRKYSPDEVFPRVLQCQAALGSSCAQGDQQRELYVYIPLKLSTDGGGQEQGKTSYQGSCGKGPKRNSSY